MQGKLSHRHEVCTSRCPGVFRDLGQGTGPYSNYRDLPDDAQTAQFEKASPPSQRIRAIQALQAEGYDVAIRLSPIIEEYMDFDKLNDLGIERCVVEFLRVNSWIKQWFRGVDFSKYTVRQGGYYHLPLKEKQRIVEKIHIPQKTICEDVTEHYQFWRDFVNPNKEDCCNLRKTHH